jgi:exopolysaccharide biosynthesis polyprenyl glycosylphosphotransferase
MSNITSQLTVEKKSSKARSQNDLRASKYSKFRKGFIFRWLRITSLLSLDSLSLALAWGISNILGTPMNSPWRLEDNPYSFFPVVGIIVGILAARGLYGPGDKRRDYRGLVKAVFLGNALLLLVAFFYAPDQFISRTHFLYFLLFSIISTCLVHFLVDVSLSFFRKKGIVSYPVFLIADPEDADRAIGLIKSEARYSISGIEDSHSLDRDERASTFEKLEALGISEVFATWNSIKRRLFISWHFQRNGISLRVIPLEDEPMFMATKLSTVGGLPSVSFDPPMLTGIDFKLKRVLDLLSALTIVVAAFPLYLLIAVLIRLDSPGPIFYRQTRIGLHGRRFNVWKFRTMVNNADKLQKELEALNKNNDGILFKIDRDPRITKVGKFLRKYSLDELPQIFNVLCGQMSLVGPRPLPVRDVERFSEHHFIRHEVMPGITGLWQVSGRSDILDFEDVLKLDLKYIENWSLWLDFSILLRTLKVVFVKSGAY